QELVDKEVRRIVDEAEDEVVDLLERERERLEALATALLDRETLDQIEAYEVAGVPPTAAAGAAQASPLSPRLVVLSSPQVRSLGATKQARRVGLTRTGAGSLLRLGR